MNGGLYTRLCSGVLFPLHERMKGHDTVRLRRALEVSQWWPIDRLQALQIDRLRRFLAEIGERVPYYRELFRRLSFDPAEVRSI
jgi:phenylacetate-CoA ligase